MCVCVYIFYIAYVLFFYSLCDVGNAVASESRSPGHLHDIFVCVFRLDRWLFFGTVVQNNARAGVAKSRFTG